MSVWKSLANMTAAAVIAGLAGALALSPVAGISGAAIVRTNETMQSNLADLTDGTTPGVTTINDAAGQPIAWLYNQRRYAVENDQISQHMKAAIVSIEDHRFYEHDGVDIQGTARAMVTNVLAGGVEQGASTINQQYVKNYLLFIDAKDEEEQAAAVEQSIPRKLREMRMASDLDRNLSKDDILTRYLNLVPFGNRSFGVEAAARTYFGTSAAELTVPQAAMLAGMVQSSEFLNPYTNPEGATNRRDTVLRAMAANGHLTAEQAEAHIAEPLGILDAPATLPNGCIAAGDRGFFCDYVLSYLAEKGLSRDQLLDGGYTINTTLDPQTQDAARAAATRAVDPMATGVAEVINVIQPGRDSRDILAMASSRNYGLNLEAGETVLPQTSSLVGNGAGSVFKVFTAAAAIEKGMGLETVLDVPARYEARGLGTGGAANCPPNTYCVENAGTYQPQMTLREALAHSPNTTFIKLIEDVGVPAVVDMSVKLGLRSYEKPGTFNAENSIADYMRNANLGSYTLGPTAVNPLELSNVGATLASGGRWCEPTPIASVTDREGRQVFLERPDCEQAVEEGVANALADGMAEDLISGTGARAASVTGWGGQAAAKTGTTESHLSSAFLGFNSGFAAAPYIYNDGTTSSPLCTSPVRQCGSGNLFGGREAAETWFNTANMLPAAVNGVLPGHDPKYDLGTTNAVLAEVVGMTESAARGVLEGKGYHVVTRTVDGQQPQGRVERAVADGVLERGSTVTLELSRGHVPAPAPAPRNTEPSPDTAPGPTPRRPQITQQDLDDVAAQLRDALGL